VVAAPQTLPLLICVGERSGGTGRAERTRMSHPHTRSPGRTLDAPSARRSILGQHQRLRALLERARRVADLALDGEAADPGGVAVAIGELVHVMESHLAFEESLLLPILNADLPHGPARAAELAKEHEQQRAMLSALHRQATAAPRVPTLATKLMFLTDWLLADMSHEEEELLSPAVLGDGADP